MSTRRFRCGGLWLLCIAAGAAAHEARPVAVSIRELGDGLYAVELRAPASIDADNRPTVQWPEGCTTVAARLVRCARPVPGKSIAVVWPIYNPAVTTLLRYQPQQGAPRTAVLPPGQTQWMIPALPTPAAVMRSYFRLGVEHILGGPDHLLFVAGLLLIAGGLRRVVMAISGFTLAHSLTLSLAALGFVHVPVPPTEACIALSILFLAREALLRDTSSLAYRFPLLVSASFGLLHGLGFAAALGEVGLPDREIPAALLFFNIGVEAGQLAFILVVLAAAMLLRRWLITASAQSARLLVLARVTACYAIGVPAAFWLLQRFPLPGR